jgi:hypothetical protein
MFPTLPTRLQCCHTFGTSSLFTHVFTGACSHSHTQRGRVHPPPALYSNVWPCTHTHPVHVDDLVCDGSLTTLVTALTLKLYAHRMITAFSQSLLVDVATLAHSPAPHPLHVDVATFTQDDALVLAAQLSAAAAHVGGSQLSRNHRRRRHRGRAGSGAITAAATHAGWLLRRQRHGPGLVQVCPWQRLQHPEPRREGDGQRCALLRDVPVFQELHLLDLRVRWHGCPAELLRRARRLLLSKDRGCVGGAAAVASTHRQRFHKTSPGATRVRGH